jgi:glucoamylase
MSIVARKIISMLFLLCWAMNSCAAAPSKTVLWLNTQADFSTNKIIENISPSDGLPGAVLAAKSRVTPDYYYHWVRDAALTMIAMNDVYRTTENVETKNKIRQLFFDYTNFSSHIQNRVHNLGEPKFYVTGEVYEKPWGRPQNDGPALRAISLIQFANVLIAEGQQAVVLKTLYRPTFPADSPIKKDLEYVSHHWKDPSFAKKVMDPSTWKGNFPILSKEEIDKIKFKSL